MSSYRGCERFDHARESGSYVLSLTSLRWHLNRNNSVEHIPYTRRCTEGVAHSYTFVPIIVTAVNDTLVYVAISYRLATISMVSGTWRARAKSFFTGNGLHSLSKALLESGQVYYLSVAYSVALLRLTNPYISVTIGVAIASICAPSAPGETKVILGSVYYPLASAMACRVYRAVLLGIITERPLNTIEISSALRAAAKIQYGSDDEITRSEPDVPPNLPIGVAVEMGRQVETPDGCTLWEPGLTGDHVRYDASHRV
jgi:hypothetical protein